jgi:lysophospholipase L1-like esterase
MTRIRLNTKWTSIVWHIVGSITLAVLLLGTQSIVVAQGTNERWVGTWATSAVMRPRRPEGQAPADQPAQARAAQPARTQGGRGNRQLPTFTNQTLRQIVRVSLGGEQARVVLSNAFGTAPLAIGAAHLALRAADAAIVPDSDRILTFSGRPSMMIPAGSVAFSDPVDLDVPPRADLAIDLYLPDVVEASTSPFTTHTGAWQTSYISSEGDHTGAAEMPVMDVTQSWFFLARVEVAAREEAGVLVAFGDSITDGTRSTPDTNNRWPDHFAKRLAAQRIQMGVLNAGISGNRVLSDGSSVSALARFDRDVLAATGVTHVTVLLGTNDIGGGRENPSPTAEDIIVGHRQFIDRAHAQGLTIYGATLAPFEGANYWTSVGELKRQALNDWIRTSDMYDAVIDFDEVLRDPAEPTKLRSEYDSGDHLHPNDAGYEAMANKVDVELFTTGWRLSGAAR